MAFPPIWPRKSTTFSTSGRDSRGCCIGASHSKAHCPIFAALGGEGAHLTSSPLFKGCCSADAKTRSCDCRHRPRVRPSGCEGARCACQRLGSGRRPCEDGDVACPAAEAKRCASSIDTTGAGDCPSAARRRARRGASSRSNSPSAGGYHSTRDGDAGGCSDQAIAAPAGPFAGGQFDDHQCRR